LGNLDFLLLDLFSFLSLFHLEPSEMENPCQWFSLGKPSPLAESQTYYSGLKIHMPSNSELGFVTTGKLKRLGLQ
jgi:hypothetical protein